MHSKEDSSGVTSAPSHQASPGQMLRAAREAKGLHLAVLSVALKVPTRQLEALENDQYDAFKGTIFVRALAQAVCRHLGMDPAPVLAALPKSVSPLAVTPPVSPSLASSGKFKRSGQQSIGKGVSRWVLWLAALMLVVAAALIWWPQSQPDLSATSAFPPQASPVDAPAEQASEPAEAPATAASVAPVAAPTAVPSAAPSAAPTVAPPVASPAAPVKPVVPASAARPAQDPAAATEAPLLIRASADAWISVRDSQGQIVLNRKVKSGESVKLDMSAPLFVYASRPDGIELMWRGQAVDLKPHTQNNEIRLFIKP